MKKIDYYTGIFYNACGGETLVCPEKNCRRTLSAQPPYSLRCDNGHTFDISAKGWVNFTKTPPNPEKMYGEQLFNARAYVFLRGFFKPLYDEIAGIANQYDKSGTAADFGCGEGSGIRYLNGKCRFDLYAAIDLSKEGIRAGASGSLDKIMWLVADIANPPLNSGSIDCLINVLSPASYAEFDRVLKDGGLLIKVIPESGYLNEIRDFLGGGTGGYSNEGVYQIFKQRYPHMREKRVSYKFPSDPEFLRNLAKMTPLMNHTEEAEAERFANSGICTISADFRILYCKKEC